MLILSQFYKITLIALVMAMASACSSIRPYKNSSPENMSITTDVQKGAVQLNVYDIDSACNMTYQGTVDLPNNKVKFALPTNKPIYLVFEFSSGSVFTGSSRNSYETYLTLHAGYQYEALVSYIDNMYGATIYEQDVHGRGRRKIPYASPPCPGR